MGGPCSALVHSEISDQTNSGMFLGSIQAFLSLLANQGRLRMSIPLSHIRKCVSGAKVVGSELKDFKWEIAVGVQTQDTEYVIREGSSLMS